MTSTRLATACLLVLALAACGGGGGTAQPGAQAFTSQPPGGSASRGGAVDAGTSGAPSTATPGTSADATAGSGGSTASRAVAEADVYARAGDLLYVLNGYRGLQVIDLADPGHPRLVGRLPLAGTPVDLYLRGATAYLLVSDAFAFLPLADGTARPERTSRIVAVDVSRPAAPAVTGELDVEGQVETSRLVGDVLYVVSRRWGWYGWAGPAAGVVVGAPGSSGSAGSGTAAGGASPLTPPADGADAVLVASVDLADPAHPRAVGSLAFSSTGWEVHADVTSSRITLAFGGWQAGAPGDGLATWFVPVDCADPKGAITAGTPFPAVGLVRDRWSMGLDEATGIFRAVLATGWNAGAALRTWKAPTPATATPLATLEVPVAEALTAARLDGPRVYLVTARITDPLWVVDAADPAKPRLAGQLAMPGQLDYIEPRGDRLLALGHTGEAGVSWQLAASLLDVADLAAPRLLSRATFGGSWGWTGASIDDQRKAFLVFDPPPASIGLVLVPVQGWDAATWTYAGGTQLIDWAGDALTLRGFLSHPGAPKRAFPLDAAGTRLAALSDQALQVVDASDRGAPRELSRLDLARPVQAVEILPGALVELSGDWTRGDTELVVTPLRDPDTAAPLARVHVPAPLARSYRVGSVIWLLATDWASGKGWLQAVDFADPLHPVKRGTLSLSAADSDTARGGWWGWGSEAALLGTVLAVHRISWPTCVKAPCDPLDELRLYDLSDPAAPRLASTTGVPGSAWSWGLLASGRYLWLTHFEWGPAQVGVTDGTAWGRYYLDRLDVTDPAHPVLLQKVNVPGVLTWAGEDGKTLVTLETSWRGTAPSSAIHKLELTADGGARLVATTLLAGYPSGAVVSGGHAYVATTDWSAATPGVHLLTIDLGTMLAASDEVVEASWAWAATAAGGKLFLQAGWQDQGVLVFGLGDPARPAFEKFVRTDGWVQQIAVGGGVAYLPSGVYGVPMIELTP